MGKEHERSEDMGTDKAKLMVYLEAETKEALGQLAELDGRSMSNFVEMLIKREIEEARKKGTIK